MNIFIALPVLILAVVVQSTFIPQLRILGGQPDFVLLLVLAWAVRVPLQEGVIWAFVGGILHDLLSAAPIGTSTLSLLILVFIIDALKSQFVRVGILGVIPLTILGTFLQKFILLIVMVAGGFQLRPVETLTYHLLPSLAFNLAAILPIYVLSRRMVK